MFNQRLSLRDFRSIIMLATSAALVTIITLGCTVAKFSSFPQRAAFLNFNQLDSAFAVNSKKEKGWTSKTVNEYYFKVNTVYSWQSVRDATSDAFAAAGYKIVKEEPVNSVVYGFRDQQTNEWNSLVAVYFNTTQSATQIYIQVRITQDFTGGWKENRAQKIGVLLKKRIEAISS